MYVRNVCTYVCMYACVKLCACIQTLHVMRYEGKSSPVYSSIVEDTYVV